MIETPETALAETPALEDALPVWTSPEITRVELKRTMLASGIFTDADGFTSQPN